MAKYDRRFLVPYLQDVCWVELEYQKRLASFSIIQSEHESLRSKVAEIDKLEEPSYPREEDYVKTQFSVELVMAILTTILAIVLFSVEYYWVFALVVAVVLWIVVAAKSKERNCELETYQEKENEYLRQKGEYDAAKSSGRELRDRMAVCFRQSRSEKEQLAQITELREKLYSVNIIPNKYHNPHAAYYLYDYFSSSQEDDLDGIIKTMLLDDIVKQLDDVIKQQRESMAIHRRQVAMQESFNEQIAGQHAEQMRAIAATESNQLQQVKYLQMLDERIRVNNYFMKQTYKQEKEWIETHR